MNFLATYIMRGRIQAMIVASSLALLSLMMPPVSVVSSATVALVTLRRGASEGLTILVCSSVAAGLLGLLAIGNYQFALLYVMVLWLPVWLISIVLREGQHLSLAVEIAILIGIFGVIGFYLYTPEPAAMWKAVLSQMVPADAPVADIQRTIDILAHYMTGVVAAGSVLGLLLGLFLGRWWQANLYNPGGFKQEFLALDTKPRLSIGSIAVVAIALTSPGVISEIAWNVSILLFVLYTVTGTSVLHTVFSKMKLGRYMVPMLYITLFLIPHAMLLVALVGLSDPWLDLRKKKSDQHTPDGV
ncbi:MAG: DUF2232 domain-containing protein [Methylococcales bacterium]|nr:DUF2232 domain-containing protein [Methylococcales bacterium]MDD5632968.1 DUF2232 domain-containing protein [Methylococcales bacterium]